MTNWYDLEESVAKCNAISNEIMWVLFERHVVVFTTFILLMSTGVRQNNTYLQILGAIVGVIEVTVLTDIWKNYSKWRAVKKSHLEFLKEWKGL